MLFHFGLQRMALAVGHDGSANFSTALQDAHDCGLVLVPVPVIRRRRWATCMFRAFPADESFVGFHFAAQ